jgi:hypothetical protein
MTQSERVLIEGDVYIGTLFVAPEPTAALIAALREKRKRGPNSPKADPADQLAFDEQPIPESEPASPQEVEEVPKQEEEPVDSFPIEYEDLDDADKELADYGEELLARQLEELAIQEQQPQQAGHSQPQPEKSFIARNNYLRAMFPLISTMNTMVGLRKSAVRSADSLVGGNITKEIVEQNAKILLAAACGACALSESCRVKAFSQWNRVHPYETRVVRKDRIISEESRQAIIGQKESRAEYKAVLKADPTAHCNPDER